MRLGSGGFKVRYLFVGYNDPVLNFLEHVSEPAAEDDPVTWRGALDTGSKESDGGV
jgi:hypothetical protein